MNKFKRIGDGRFIKKLPRVDIFQPKNFQIILNVKTGIIPAEKVVMRTDSLIIPRKVSGSFVHTAHY